MKTFIFLAFFTLSLYSIDVFQGKSEVIILEDIDKNSVVKFQNKVIKPIPNPLNKKQMLILLPVDYKSLLGEYTLEYLHNNSKKSILIHVKKGIYKKEELRVNPKKVNPPKEMLEQIQKEYKEANAIYDTNGEKIYWKKPFIYPLESEITSNFGNARVFNDTLKSYHSGVDFRAQVGTPIKATNDGKVVLVKERYYAGGSVIIDHGNGLYSCYFHMSKFFVKVGDIVKQGEVLGLSGKSGRVTGPHLHFSFKLFNTTIDPLDFITKVNTSVFN